MRNTWAVCLTILMAGVLAGTARAQHWPSFRGPHASGVAEGPTPLTFDGEKMVNVAWRTEIPGFGHSSPVVWGDQVFVTTAVSSDARANFERGPSQSMDSSPDASRHIWRVYCLDRQTGRIVWDRTASEGAPRARRHVRASYANPTPATDGRHVVAFFGSEGLYCYDTKGRLIWRQDLGLLDGGYSSAPDAHWGFASSPIIYRDLVIVQCDTQKDSFIAAYRLSDGKMAWRTPRDEDTSWSSPTIYEGPGRVELIASGTRFYRGYDPETGKELWRLADGSDVKIPTPVAAHGLIYLGGGNSHKRRAFYAVRAGASGELSLPEGQDSAPGIAWRRRASPHLLTPIVYGDYVYVCADNGVLTQYHAKTGEQMYVERIGGKGTAFTASPVAAGGKLYFSSEDGEVLVVKAGPAYELLARNPVGEAVMATPAIAGGMLIIRGERHVYGIRERG